VYSAASVTAIGVSAAPTPVVYTVGTFTAGGGFLTCYPPGVAGVNPAGPIGYLAGAATTLMRPEGVTASSVTGLFYATDFSNTALDEWQLSCPSGQLNVGPVRQLQGGLTQMGGPIGVAVDASRNVIYVANYHGSTVTMYHLNQNGNVAPVCVLAGLATRLSLPEHIAIEPAVAGARHSGYLYVANLGNNSVSVYPPVPCGNIAPFNRIAGPLTGLHRPTGIDVYTTRFPGHKGPAIYVADPATSEISVYTDGGGANRAPFQIIGGAPSMLACPNDVRVSAATLLIYAVDPCAMEIDAYANTTPFNMAPFLWYVAPGGFVDNAFGVWLSDRN